MNNPIQETIRLLSAHIARLQDIIKTLQDLKFNEVSVPPVTPGHAEDEERGHDTFLIDGEYPSTGTPCANLAIVSRLAEPISSADLARAAGIQSRAAACYLWRLEQKGWLKKTGRGRWERTRKYPQLPAEPLEVPREPDEAGSQRASLTLKEQLEAACKARDRARETGRDKLADIEQRKIDDLTSRIEKGDK